MRIGQRLSQFAVNQPSRQSSDSARIKELLSSWPAEKSRPGRSFKEYLLKRYSDAEIDQQSVIYLQRIRNDKSLDKVTASNYNYFHYNQ